MDYNDFIMTLLEEKGLDKRFRDNPEAVSQICSLVIRDIEQKNGKSLQNSGRKEIEETARRVLEGYDNVGNDGIRHDNVYSINEDGSFSVKHKTDVRRSSVDVSRADSEQIFSLGKEKGDLIVTESSEYISQTQDHTYASTGVKFNVFNSNGLEIQSRNVSQSVNVDTAIRINNSVDAFNAIGRSGVKWEMSPVTETVLDRGSDLATEHYCVRESKDSRILAFEKGKIISENRSQDAISDPMPICYSLGGNTTGQTKRGVMPNFPPQYRPGHLMGYTDYMAESYAKQTDEERDAAIQSVYDVSTTQSKAFRETLFDSAKTNPALQEVVEKLDLVRTTNENDARLMTTLGIVKVADLERVYEGVSDKELRSTIQTIIETSKEANKQKKTDGIEK